MQPKRFLSRNKLSAASFISGINLSATIRWRTFQPGFTTLGKVRQHASSFGGRARFKMTGASKGSVYGGETSSARDEVGRQLVLVSGGVESSTLLRRTHDAFGSERTAALFFDYGQRAVTREFEATKRQCETLRLADDSLISLDISALGRGIAGINATSANVRRFVPIQHRNGVLLSIAASVAAQDERIDGIWIAICKDDLDWYPSASMPFLQSMRDALHTLDGRFQLHTPFVDMHKHDVIKHGLKHGVDFSTTWSCMLGHSSHCGRCMQCKSRKAAFQECNVSEGDQFYER